MKFIFVPTLNEKGQDLLESFFKENHKEVATLSASKHTYDVQFKPTKIYISSAYSVDGKEKILRMPGDCFSSFKRTD